MEPRNRRGIFRVPTEGGKFDRHYHDCDEYWLIFKGKAKILPFGLLAYCKDSIAGLEVADVEVVHHFADGDAIAQHGGLIPTIAGETVVDTKCASISNPVALQTNE